MPWSPREGFFCIHFLMRHFVIILFSLLLCAKALQAQEFSTHWIHAPQGEAEVPSTADSLAYVEFRQTYLSFAQPQQASITVASTGWFRLYVNQCNVGTAAFYPPRDTQSAHELLSAPCGRQAEVAFMTFDVTDYLRPDTNVVALIYAPYGPSATTKQVSVAVFGTDHDGLPFSFTTDSTWLCRPAEAALSASCLSTTAPDAWGENIDGRRHDPDWNAATISTDTWAHAMSTPPADLFSTPPTDHLSTPPTDHLSTPPTDQPTLWQGLSVQPTNLRTGLCPAPRTLAVLSPDTVLTRGDTLICCFPEAFTGRIRLTIRDARHGESIVFGNSTYTCSGHLDEQACPLFVLTRQHRISITGDHGFRPSHIVNIEGLVTNDERLSPPLPR